MFRFDFFFNKTVSQAHKQQIKPTKDIKLKETEKIRDFSHNNTNA